jgi:threonine dehydrogenase-like Zn-dependent dehydrogenase
VTVPFRAFWLARPGTGEIRPEAARAPGPGEVLVEALYSGISRGTETLVFRGLVPESEWQRMRCPFQAGDFPGPVKYGYCSVGRVADGPSELVGRAVFCLHPHQDRYVVPAAAVRPLPDGLPPERAVLAANMETALNGLWDGEVRPGDRVCVIGAGVLGLLVASLAQTRAGAHVLVVDVDSGKEAAARALGLAFATMPAPGAAYDRVFHTSASEGGLRSALAAAGFEATVIELSWFGSREVSLPLGADFHAKRLTIRSSQVGAVAPAQRPRWDYERRMAAALSLLADDRYDALVSGESRFEDLPAVMAALADGSLPALCHSVRYDRVPGA